MALKITRNLIPSGTKARPGKKLANGKAIGVVIHNTGNTSKGAGASNHQKYLYNNRNNTSNGFHWVVDDKEAIQLIPDNEMTAQSGSTKGNQQTTSIEICENSDGNLLTTTNNGAELAAAILKSLGFTKAVWKQNIWQHNDWSSYGKNCPSRIRAGQPYDWTTFVKKVNEYMNQGATLPSGNGTISLKNSSTSSTTSAPSTSTTTTVYPSLPFMITITTAELNVRASASMSGKVITTLKKGEKITVDKRNGNWLYSSELGGYFVGNNSSYLTITPLPFYVHSNVNTVNIRNAPSTKAGIVRQLKDKTEQLPVTVTRERGKWYGFIDSQYGWADYFTPKRK